MSRIDPEQLRLLRRQDVNVYINFSLYAILGKLAEADDLIERHGAAVHRVADFLAKRMPIARAPLYRGMLVDGPVAADHRYKFISWSEDRNVAFWFATRGTVISEYVLEHRPSVRGVVLELPQSSGKVLFHHAWANAFDDGAGAAVFAHLAARHPHMGLEGARQIAWSLRTQREVITAPLAELPPAVDVETLNPPTAAELDSRFAPPWIGD